MEKNTKSKRTRGKGKKTASRDEVRQIAKTLGMTKTRQSLVNLGRASKMPLLRAPQGPRAGANYTTREMATTFGTSTGLTGNSIIQSGSTDHYGAIAFQLSDLQNSFTYASLFDQYRLEHIRIHFRSRNSSAFMANTASPNAAMPWGLAVVDRDDSTAPTAMTALQQYDNVCPFSGCDSFYIDLVPSLTPAVFSGGAFSAYAVRDSDSMWIDIANASVPTYGVKFGVTQLTLSTTSKWIWDIFGEYIVSFRKNR